MRKSKSLNCCYFCLAVCFTMVFLYLVAGCSTIGSVQISDETKDILMEESIDAIGYTLGLLAAKDPDLRKDIEYYYKTVESGNYTLVALNLIFKKYSEEDAAYKLLIYKVSGLIKRLGGEVLPDGTIESLGGITKEHLEIGKNAYLLAINTSEVN